MTARTTRPAATQPRTRSQNGRRSRSKGHAWERDVAAIFAALYPGNDVRRNIAQSRTAKREGCDVLGLPWWVECKVGAAVNLRSALEQAERDAGTVCPSVLIVGKVDRRPPVVYARLRVLVEAAPQGMRIVGDEPAMMLLKDFVSMLAGSSMRLGREESAA